MRPSRKAQGPSATGADGALFDALRAWRRAAAERHNVPAYVIFHDSTLRQIAAQKPATLGELAGIAGIGAKKLEAYGAEILQVVAS